MVPGSSVLSQPLFVDIIFENEFENRVKEHGGFMILNKHKYYAIIIMYIVLIDRLIWLHALTDSVLVGLRNILSRLIIDSIMYMSLTTDLT